MFIGEPAFSLASLKKNVFTPGCGDSITYKVMNSEVSRLKQELQRQFRHNSELRDSAQRMQADLEEYQKKVNDEQHEAWLSGVVPLLKKVLELIDDLEKVLEIQPDRARVLTWNSQLGFIYNRLQDILKTHQVKPIQVLDKPFDPALHQAQEIFEEFTGPDTIEICTEELKHGYMIGDQLLRPSLVRVTRSLPF